MLEVLQGGHEGLLTLNDSLKIRFIPIPRQVLMAGLRSLWDLPQKKTARRRGENDYSYLDVLCRR